jgi:hypothetical protein
VCVRVNEDGPLIAAGVPGRCFGRLSGLRSGLEAPLPGRQGLGVVARQAVADHFAVPLPLRLEVHASLPA